MSSKAFVSPASEKKVAPKFWERTLCRTQLAPLGQCYFPYDHTELQSPH